MHEMHVDAIDGRLEVRQLVQLSFVLAPVIRGSPILQQLFHVRPIRSIVPARAWDLVWQPRPLQTRLEVGEGGILYSDGEFRHLRDPSYRRQCQQRGQ